MFDVLFLFQKEIITKNHNQSININKHPFFFKKKFSNVKTHIISLFLLFFERQIMETKVITVFSTFGGTWKTTSAITLAKRMWDSGKNVGFIDWDPKCNATSFLTSMKGVDSEVTYGELFRAAYKRTELTKLERMEHKPKNFYSFVDIFESTVPGEGYNDFFKRLPYIGVELRGTKYINGSDASSTTTATTTKGRFQLLVGSHFMDDYVSKIYRDMTSNDPTKPSIEFFRRLVSEFSQRYSLDYVFFDLSSCNDMINRMALSVTDTLLCLMPADKSLEVSVSTIEMMLNQFRTKMENCLDTNDLFVIPVSVGISFGQDFTTRQMNKMARLSESVSGVRVFGNLKSEGDKLISFNTISIDPENYEYSDNFETCFGNKSSSSPSMYLRREYEVLCTILA